MGPWALQGTREGQPGAVGGSQAGDLLACPKGLSSPLLLLKAAHKQRALLALSHGAPAVQASTGPGCLRAGREAGAGLLVRGRGGQTAGWSERAGRSTDGAGRPPAYTKGEWRCDKKVKRCSD